MTMKTTRFGDWLPEWTAHTRRALDIAHERNQALLASFSTTVNVTSAWLVHAFSSHLSLAPRYYWSHPTGDHTLLGVGSAYTCNGYGPERFQQVRQEVQSVEAALFATHPQSIRWLGGFSFDAGPHSTSWVKWADASLTIPVFLFECVASDTRMTVSQWIHPDDDWERVYQDMTGQVQALTALHEKGFHTDGTPVQEIGRVSNDEASGAEFDWKAAVERTATDIRRGLYEKVVLARQQTIYSEVPFSVADAILRLRSAYADSFVYGIHQHGQYFLGASPERLVRVTSGEVSVDCLAGTIARGQTLEEDTALGEQLLKSSKNRTEHAVVLRWLQSCIEGVVQDFSAASAPTLKKLRNVQHLHTPIRAKLAAGWSVLDIASKLHPTPAVAGEPREKAMEMIRQRENMDRGWYAGATGWKGVNGDGEFSVALRCALVDGCEAHLIAGAGIMGDSDPEQEWIETKLKMRPMEMALGCVEEVKM